MKFSTHMMHPQQQSQHFAMGRGLAALGRGPDSTLVHMSNKELGGLQHIAMAHGGSLTINPHTGLPEAGFLSSILPDIAGAALMATGVGAPLAALAVGAGDALVTKDWKQGLAAGLGAYGGASVMGGLAGMGAQAGGAAASAGMPAATTSVGADLPNAAVGQTVSGAGQGASGIASGGASGATTYADPAISATTSTTNPQSIVATGVKNGQIQYGTAAQQQAAQAAAGRQASEQAYTSGISNTFDPSQAGSVLSNAQAGTSQLGSSSGWQDLYKSAGKVGLAGLAAPGLYQAATNQPAIPSGAHGNLYSTVYNPGRQNPYQGPGQNPIQGQGYGPMTSDGSYASGGRVRHYGSGGPLTPTDVGLTPPTPAPASQSNFNVPPSNFTPSAANSQGIASQPNQSQLAQYYQSLMSAPPAQQAAQPSFPPQQPANPNAIQKTNPAPSSNPTSNTFSNYMNNLNQYLTPQGSTAPASKPAAPSAGPAASSSGTGLVYNPSTGTYTQAPAVVTTPPRATPPANGAGGFTFQGGYASGGLTSLGNYSDGGQLLRGPGDGTSDGIPAMIAGNTPQKAALSSGEFVIPARHVSELGNGSTEAGSKKLYAMLDRIQAGRRKSIGKSKGSIDSGMDKELPA